MNVATPCGALDGPAVRSDVLLRALFDEPRIVFDLDGTLYDTRDFERPALEAVVAWLRDRSGRALPGAAAALSSQREQDRHRPGLFDELLEAEGLPQAWGKECLERFHAHPGMELESAPSLRGVVSELRSGGRSIALVSNGNPVMQKRKLDRLGMIDLFDACIFCNPNMADCLKPSAWAWTQLAAWRNGHRGVYVGDDPVDATFAAAGGAQFVPFRFRNPAYGD